MSEQEERGMHRREGEEDLDEVEAHRRSTAESIEPQDDEESSDDFEAHRRGQM